MTDQQIYALMAKTSNIRAVQIADALDQELATVSDALKSLVDDGTVVRHSGLAPNGQAAQMYNLSESFMLTNDYLSIKKEPAGAAAAAPAPLATEPSPGVATPAAAVKTPAASRIDSAIAYVRLLGKVSNADLKKHMGLRHDQAPASWLTTAVRDGRLVRHGTDWTLGSITPQPTASRATAPTLPRGEIPDLHAAMANNGHQPAPGAASVAAASVTAVADSIAPTAGPAFRCGLWSDDVLELQRDGVTLTKLTRAEGEQMHSFFGRMLATTVTP